MDKTITLEEVRIALNNLEKTISAALLDRARFMHDRRAYIPGAFEFEDGREISLFEQVARDRERGCARMGRYEAWDERPFFLPIAKPIIKREYEHPPIAPVKVDFTKRILIEYLAFLPKFCAEGDDKHYGSAADRDVTALQAIAQRVHYGTLVMEVKYLQNKAAFDRLILEKDVKGILEKITDSKREYEVLKNVLKRARNIGLEKPEEITIFYRDSIIPMTKDVQVEYLLRRKRALKR